MEMKKPEAIDLFRALGLVEKRRVASGRYVTATAGPADGWLYFATYRTTSGGYWFGVCPEAPRTEIPPNILARLETEGFEKTNKNYEAIRLVGEDIPQSAPAARLVMVELQEMLGTS